jgi:hypothetical protein
MSSSGYYAVNSAIGAGAEVTYGTAAARTVWSYVKSCSFKPFMTRQDREYTRHSATSFNSREDFVARRGWSGTLVQEMTYDNMGIWLRQWIGAGTTTGPSGSIYQHTFKRALAFPVGLTCELNRGQTAKDLYTGGKVMRGTLSHDVESGNPASLSLDFIGTTHARSDSAASVTARTNETLMHYADASGTAGNINFNSANYAWKSYELTVDNGLAERRFNGSLYTQEPLRDAVENVSLKATVEVDDAFMTAYEAGTQSDITITYNDPNSLKLFVINVHNAILYEVDDTIPQGRPGMIMANLVWKGFTDGTDDGVSFVVDNLTTTAIGQG